MTKRLVGSVLLIAVMSLAACTVFFDEDRQVDGFVIRLAAGDTGALSAPLAFPEEPLRYVLDVRAVNAEGRLAGWFNGKLAVSMHPVGRLASGQASRFEMTGGKLDGLEVFVEACHGATTIWVEDAGGIDRTGTYAVGTTPILYFASPTIAQLQRTDDYESSALEGDFVELRVADREVVVTNVRRDGFYCQDLTEPDGAYGGVYVYTHNQPEGIEAGARLTELRGQADEFFGFTELGFPDYLADGELPEPAPFVIGLSRLSDNDAMEEWEGSLVEVQDVRVCPTDEQYELYDQWPVLLDPEGDCSDETATILVAETAVFDELDPPSLAGATLSRVIGNQRYHAAAEPSWMIVPRYASDVQ
jgi:hypothetical protein